MEETQIDTLRYAVYLLFKFLETAIFVDVILSWIMPGKENRFTEVLHSFTNPFMMPARKLQDKIAPGLMIDFSPIGAYLILRFLEQIIFSFLG